MLSPSSPARPARPDGSLRLAALIAYGVGFAVLLAAFSLRQERTRPSVHTLQRGLERGEVGPDLPRLDPTDAMANAAVLSASLLTVPHPGFGDPTRPCLARARSFAVMLDGRLSRVRFGARSVCQLQKLKQISLSQPGFGPHGLAEVPAFVLGRRLAGGDDVDVTRIVIPPFRFAGDSVTFEAADLGQLQPGERFIGTYHTHPEDDLTQGVLSETDLEYMRSGFVDFSGDVGPLDHASDKLDWLFDIVDPRDGEWNVYAHDGQRLAALRQRCTREPSCPLNELRLAGSPYNLFARVYEERDDDLP